jgi:protein-tyrosine-phosphatase
MNSIRSPMAEALVKDICGTRIYCDSAGTREGDPDGFAISVMAERGLNLEHHKSKLVEDLDDLYFDLIVTLSPQAHHKVLDLTSSEFVEVEYWPTLDPSTIAGSRDQVLEAYRQLRDGLETKIRTKFAK